MSALAINGNTPRKPWGLYFFEYADNNTCLKSHTIMSVNKFPNQVREVLEWFQYRMHDVRIGENGAAFLGGFEGNIHWGTISIHNGGFVRPVLLSKHRVMFKKPYSFQISPMFDLVRLAIGTQLVIKVKRYFGQRMINEYTLASYEGT